MSALWGWCALASGQFLEWRKTAKRECAARQFSVCGLSSDNAIFNQVVYVFDTPNGNARARLHGLA
jgi:hypothetical protein